MVALQQNSDPGFLLRMAITLQCTSPNDISEIQTNLPRIVDAIESQVQALGPADLRGRDAVIRLRKLLFTAVTGVVPKAQVQAVQLRELVLG
jgi:hypothetical protein